MSDGLQKVSPVRSSPVHHLQTLPTNDGFPSMAVCSGEKQAATHVSLDQEYDVDLANMWCHLEEQLVASTNKGVVPLNFQPSQYCLNSQTDNLLQPLAVMGGTRSWPSQSVHRDVQPVAPTHSCDAFLSRQNPSWWS